MLLDGDSVTCEVDHTALAAAMTLADKSGAGVSKGSYGLFTALAIHAFRGVSALCVDAQQVSLYGLSSWDQWLINANSERRMSLWRRQVFSIQ